MRAATCRGGRGQRGHLFLCRPCRIERRIAAAWRAVPRPADVEVPQAPAEDFVRRVAAAAALDRRRRLRRRAVLSAAAALLFFFLAGAGQKAESDSFHPEETYSQLLTQSALESLLPE
ncbi:MAG TPA: hypothetical protein VKH43_03335 [Thermoanaerobaculia bacterium]|nr:hypothetical protein [Thermoanaerobaculia bacterium]